MENTTTSGQDEELSVEQHLEAWVEHEVFRNRDNCLPNDYADRFFDLTGFSRESIRRIIERYKDRISIK